MTLSLLLKRIEEQREVLETTAGEAEELRTAPARLVDALRAIGVPLAKVPKEVGGYQLTAPEQLRFYEALAYANPTAGWGSCTGVLGACLERCFQSKV